VVFSSLSFLFLYLPLVLLGHMAVLALLGRADKRRWALATGNVLILLASLLFYMWGEGWLVWILLASTCVDYVAGLGIQRAGWRDAPPGPATDAPPAERRRSRTAKLWLLASLASNLGFLAYFKYLGFGLDVLRGIAGDADLLAFVPEVALPLGISFYTFQSMSYTIDVYRGQVPATRNILDFATYVSMFPQLVAGPIVRYVDVAAELVERHVDVDRFVVGFRRFLLGLAKKVLLANTLSEVADAAFAASPGELTAPGAWLGLIAYSGQIYFDFSGYSDMAIGLGALFGFRFPENFRWPYAARSIQDFWRRWHISLSTWFRDYLYISLGGNRGGALKTSRNLMLVFLLCGLWHGASWNFVIWGVLHGVFLSIERAGWARVLERLPAVLRHVYVMFVVMIAWVLFRADDLPATGHYLAALFTGGAGFGPVHPELTPRAIAAFVVGAVACTGVPTALLERWRAGRAPQRPAVQIADRVVSLGYCVALGLLCTAYLFQGASNPFIYFRF